MSIDLEIREARLEDHTALGALTVTAYRSLEGAPTLEEGRPYYDDLRDVARRASSDRNVIVVACDASSGALLGGSTYVAEGYGRKWGIDAAGIRMLAVDLDARGRGVGEALVRDSVDRARAAGKPVILLHTAQVMQVAQRLYARLGFCRRSEMDISFMGTDLMAYQLDLG